MLIVKKGSSQNISLYLQKYKTNKIFVVCGKNSFKTKMVQKSIKNLKKAYDIFLFNGFSSNPKYEDALRGTHLFKKSKAEIILAIGGGSAIDTAKLINAFQCYDSGFKKIVNGKIKANKNLKPLIAIPTTTGSGSEATHFAVVYLNNKKFSVSSKNLLPKISIIDSNLGISLPKYTIASSGFDALAQSIESYWSISSTKKSRKYSEKAIKIILKNLKKATLNKSENAIKNMMIAANLSGKAINITKTTAPHALSYKITHLTGFAHGHAVALILGKFFKINQLSKNIKINLKRSIFLKRLKNLYSILGVKDYLFAEKKWYSLMRICKLETNLNKNLNKSKINLIISSINEERLANHPVEVSNNELEKLFI